jgi:hypothetical protein
MLGLTGEQAAAERTHYQAIQDDASASDDEKLVAFARLAELDAMSNGHHRQACVNRWAHVDLVALIQERQDLKERSNGTFVGPHPTKHPSNSGECLVVWPADGHWYCSSCKATGDVPGWLVDRDGVTYRQACDLLRMKYGLSPDEKRWEEMLRPRYAVRMGCLGEIETRSNEDGTTSEIPRPLCNFVAWTETEVRRDDGVSEPTLELELTGLMQNGTALPTIRVPAERFPGLDWVVRHWGMGAVVHAGQARKDKLREAIQLISRDAPRRTIYSHSGWRHFGDEDGYLHAGGCVGQDDVLVELGDGLDRYRLPTGPLDADELRTAVRTSLQILELGPKATLLSLYPAVWLAPLAFIIRPSFAMWLYGRTGSLKSTLAALLTSHFGDFTFDRPPLTWDATANRIGRDLAIGRDLLLWVDDVIPKTTIAGQREMTEKVQSVLHAIGDGQGRARLRSDTSARPSYTPASLVIATAEILPSGESTVPRAFEVKLDDDVIDRTRLTVCQSQTEQLPRAMLGYLRWLQPRLADLRAELPRLRETFRQKAYSAGLHLRQPDQIACLQIGADLFSQFAVDVGAMTEGEALQFVKETWEALIAQATKNTALVFQEKPTTKFVESLQTLLDTRRVYLCSVDADDVAPEDGELWGWERRLVKDESGNLHPVHNHLSSAVKIGWIDETAIYLHAQAAYKEVSRFLAEQNQVLIGRNSLYDHLRQGGLIATSNSGPVTQMWLAGAKRRLLQISRKNWEGMQQKAEESEESENRESGEPKAQSGSGGL